ncbi:MAG: hypothetical protein ACYSO2_10165 [Planctomycetota bacterium]|jgi:hypothetical protein
MNVFMKNRSTKIIFALIALAAVITAIVAYRQAQNHAEHRRGGR